MRFCTQCGKELTDYTRFCTRCGTEMVAPSRANRKDNEEKLLSFEEVCYDFANQAEDYADSMYDEEGIYSKDSLLTKVVGFIFTVIGSIIGYSIIPGIASFIMILFCVIFLRFPFGDAMKFFIPGLLFFAFVCYFGKIIQLIAGGTTREEYYVDRDGNTFTNERDARKSTREILRRERYEKFGR